MFDQATEAAYNAGKTPQARAEAVRDKLGSSLTVEIKNGGTTKYSGTFTGPLVAGSEGSLFGYSNLVGTVIEGGEPDAETWTCRIGNGSNYIEGSFGPGGRFTVKGGVLRSGKEVRLNVRIAPFTTWPSWRKAMTPRTWIEVPATNTLSDLDPKNDPTLNPNYPNSPEWYGTSGHRAIVSAWCGACFDPDTDTLWLPLGGGHGDYAGNEPYKIRLGVDEPEFVMVRPPSGAIGNLLTTNDGQESSGVYADGRPRAVHSYNKAVYVPGAGPVYAVQGNCSWGGSTGTNKVIIFDPEDGEATFGAANSYTGGFSSASGTCYDPTRHALWYHGAGTGYFAMYDIEDDSWSSVGSSVALSGTVGLTYLPDHDCVFCLSSGNADKVRVLDCDTGTVYKPTIAGSTVGMALSVGGVQPHWVPRLGGVAMWDNSSDMATINVLTPTGNPRTDDWEITQLSVHGSNETTPTVRAGNGTYGRFAYAEKMNGFFLLNATNQKPYFFAL